KNEMSDSRRLKDLSENEKITRIEADRGLQALRYSGCHDSGFVTTGLPSIPCRLTECYARKR
ncbi:MAG: hypothetical protein GY795_05810, partial [Desulfobacterales bacterium]|nr:hypothetical protein [Desulfobacterales bacterium]